MRLVGFQTAAARGASLPALLLAAALCGAGPTAAQEHQKQPFGETAASIKALAAADAGRKIYVSSCQRCHGIRLATNGIGFDLRTFPQHDKERFLRSVTNGKGAMPAWGATLKPEQMDLIWAYIGSVNGWQ
jgi:mono/diheme cytochrome c family protein